MAKKIFTVSLVIVSINFVFADYSSLRTEAAIQSTVQPGPGTYNLQNQAVEVTQGIREHPATLVFYTWQKSIAATTTHTNLRAERAAATNSSRAIAYNALFQ